jgi:hypothetical protein
MQTEAISENIPSPRDFHVSYYWQTLNSRIWWAIFYSGFAFVLASGLARAFHIHGDGDIIVGIIAMLVFVFLFTAIGSYLRSSEKYRKLTADKNQIAPIVGYKARTYHIGMFFLKLPRNIILGMFAGFVTMMVFGGIFNNISTDASATLGMAALILFPAWLSYRSSSKDLKKINAAYIEMPAQIAAVLEKVDYYYLGIGVDVANKMLATNSIDRKYRISEPFKFSLDKVINYQAFSPGHTVISGAGLNSVQQAQIEAQNLSAQIKSKNETGLYIDLDDIYRPRVFVEMTFDQAESWVLLLNRLRKGTLEKQSTALLYPCQ